MVIKNDHNAVGGEPLDHHIHDLHGPQPHELRVLRQPLRFDHRIDVEGVEGVD